MCGFVCGGNGGMEELKNGGMRPKGVPTDEALFSRNSAGVRRKKNEGTRRGF